MPDLSITYGDLGLIILFVMTVVAGFFVIRILAGLSGSVHALKKLLRDNAANIDIILKDLPTLSENAVVLTDQATEIAEALIGEQEMVDRALEDVGDTIEIVADTARSVNEDIVGGIKKLVGVIAALVGFAAKRKEAAEKKAASKETPGVKDSNGDAAARTSTKDAPGMKNSAENTPDTDSGSVVLSDSADNVYCVDPNSSVCKKENISSRVKDRRNRLDDDRPGRREKRAAAAARRNEAQAKKREASVARRGRNAGKLGSAEIRRGKDAGSREQNLRAGKAIDKVRDINININ